MEGKRAGLEKGKKEVNGEDKTGNGYEWLWSSRSCQTTVPENAT